MLLVTAAPLRAAADGLPPPGPPPDPTRGESYDGRPPVGEPVATTIALALPRLVLWIPRILIRLSEPGFVASVSELQRLDATPPGRISIEPVLSIASDFAPTIGVSVGVRDVGGPGVSRLKFRLASGGPRFADGTGGIAMNPNYRVAWEGALHMRYRDDEPFYPMLDGDRPDTQASSNSPGRLQVLALDADFGVALRPGGNASPWRARVSLGGGLRRFGLSGDNPVDPDTVPGFESGATFGRARFSIEHVGGFDVSRDAAGLDASLEISPTIGLGAGDDKRYVTMIGNLAYGAPVGAGGAIVFSGTIGDQQSSSGVDFYDRFALGGSFFHRGFSSARFRGGSIVLLAFDYRFPLASWADGVFFVEDGNAFGEGLTDFQPAAMRTSVGMGLHLFRSGRLVFRGIIGLGLGDGFHFDLSLGPP